MEDIINIVISNGIFATLFVWLLFYQLKDSSKREQKYIATIEKLSKHLGIVEELKEDITEIKQTLFKNAQSEGENEITRKD